MCGAEGIRSVYRMLPCADHKIATILTTVLNKTTTVSNKVTSTPFYKFYDTTLEVFDMIDHCKELVRYFKPTNLQNSLKTTLKQENATRWNSLLRLLESVVGNYEDMTNILVGRTANRAILIVKIDRQLLEELARFLRPFQAATLKLEKILEPTLHLVPFERHSLIERCEIRTVPLQVVDSSGKKNTIPPDSAGIRGIKKLVKEVLREKWELDDVHVQATLLDPRQKDRLDLFEVPVAQIKRAQSGVRRMMLTVGARVEGEVRKEGFIEVVSEKERSPRPLKKRKVDETKPRTGLCSSDEEDKDIDVAAGNASLTSEEQIQKELDYYWSLKLTKDEKRSFEILAWWKAKGVAVKTVEQQLLLPPLPIMARVARAILSVSASSSKSECNFFDAGNTITKKRNSIKPSVVNDVLFVRSNKDLAVYDCSILDICNPSENDCSQSEPDRSRKLFPSEPTNFAE
ncbi:hypothetical protein CBR_g12757 [Chara braunii]|uniref:HAT C-terminal dimerisation domain-containing protein n=1 Tax=Chara braunii TaxID=69332 RepID=A0A388KSM0_CHABU|nr:hypothetical protein CBR_g12757 [Chara braunii]|eukprot:GBG73039.1 hypothetical protein CBR_g12757 [Chara braunii]